MAMFEVGDVVTTKAEGWCFADGKPLDTKVYAVKGDRIQVCGGTWLLASEYRHAVRDEVCSWAPVSPSMPEPGFCT
jgi:hypothetical protein